MAIKITCDLCKKEIVGDYWRLYFEQTLEETAAQPTGSYLVALQDYYPPFAQFEELQLCTARCLIEAEAEIRRLARKCLDSSALKAPLQELSEETLPMQEPASSTALPEEKHHS